MKSNVYFISDAHLGLGTREEERAKEDRLVEFLESIRISASQLFIVGDLFDAWFEYRTVIPKGFHRLLAKLDELTAGGIVVHYLAGNHDYWMKDFFREELGIRTYHEPFDVLVDGKKIFIHHGDGLARNDTGYAMLKKLLRSELAIGMYRWLHPDIGITIARGSSRKSRSYTSGKDYGEEDGMLQFAGEKIREGYDIVVLGHRHQPVCRELEKGVYINLGDWIEHNSFAHLEDGRIELRFWK